MTNLRDYATLFLNNTPMMDVRAPVEFERGAFPMATNLPLMNNDEREAVGTRYKEAGQVAAIELGKSLVTEELRFQRVNAWRAFVEANPSAVLYCFRGGLRSRITQQWLAEAGVDLPFIEGGYKAMRHFLLTTLQEQIAAKRVRILSGRTGSGKTEVIHAAPRAIDLEGLAKHRGSAFGRTEKPQPSQIDFENAWAIDWLKLNQTSQAPVLFEDESRLIGRIALLPEFTEVSKQADAIVLQSTLEDRVHRIRQEYWVETFQQDQKRSQLDPYQSLKIRIEKPLLNIRKRLGGERTQQLLSTLDHAIDTLKSQNTWAGFDDIIATLLSDYYDPMYQYQFSQKHNRVIFEGNQTEILEWLNTQAN